MKKFIDRESEEWEKFFDKSDKEEEMKLSVMNQKLEDDEIYEKWWDRDVKPISKLKNHYSTKEMEKLLYDINDIKLALYNSIASADLLSAYLKTDVKDKLDKLKKEYELKLKRGVTLDGFSNI